MNISKTQNLVETIEESASSRIEEGLACQKMNALQKTLLLWNKVFLKHSYVIWRFFPTNHR